MTATNPGSRCHQAAPRQFAQILLPGLRLGETAFVKQQFRQKRPGEEESQRSGNVRRESSNPHG